MWKCCNNEKFSPVRGDCSVCMLAHASCDANWCIFLVCAHNNWWWWENFLMQSKMLVRHFTPKFVWFHVKKCIIHVHPKRSLLYIPNNSYEEEKMLLSTRMKISSHGHDKGFIMFHRITESNSWLHFQVTSNFLVKGLEVLGPQYLLL